MSALGSPSRSFGALAVRVALDLAYLLATPFVLLWLLVPSRCFTRSRYRAGMAQKIGGVPTRAGDRPCLWLHAVSVGELRAALPLIEALRTAHPDRDLWVSTSTDTAQELARRVLPSGVVPFFFPLDYGFAVSRALERVRPAAIVLLELELWPNFLLAANRRGVPVLVVNGRISERSFPRYRAFGFLTRALFGFVSAVAAQNENYVERFVKLGVPRERVSMLGNLKWDSPATVDQRATTLATLAWRNDGAPLLLAASTHPGEEEALARVWGGLRREFPSLKLVVAPRHRERAGDVARLLESSVPNGGVVLRWSHLNSGGPEKTDQAQVSDVLLVDTVGDLWRFFQVADVVFLGGSLIQRGGHNLLEPAREGKPVLFGPSVENFAEIAAFLLDRQAALQISSAEELEREIARLLRSPQERQALGERAREAAGALSGATERVVAWLDLLMK